MLKLPKGKCFGNLLSHEETTMLFKSSASSKENPGSKRLRRALGLLLGSALAVQYKQDRIFRASVNL